MSARPGSAGWIAASLCAGLLAVSCSRPDPPRDIVLITIDTLRADRLGAYGNTDGLTPNLDRLAAEGVRFADASAPTPVTLPSHTSIMTGRYPSSTGVRDNGAFVVPADEVTLAELLAQRGYATGAVVAAYPLQRRYGLDQGFQRYDDELPALDAAQGVSGFFPERDATAITDRALEVWRQLEDGRRFLWVHYFDPHAPYAAPEPYGSREGQAYDAEVAYVDAEIGRLLSQLGLGRDALVMVTSDHGEGLGEHGEQTHGVFLYQTTIQVPLIFWSPERWPDAATVEQPVSLVDLTPTVMALAGVDPEPGLDGVDLVPALSGGAMPDRPVYGESFIPRYAYRFSELRLWREGPLKWIDAPQPELYDVRADPAEQDDLAASRSSEGARLGFALGEYVDTQDPDIEARARGAVDAAAREALQSLGYIAGGATSATEERGRDPKTMAAYIRDYDRALGLMARRPDEAMELLRQLTTQAPENTMTRFHMATVLYRMGRMAEAERELIEWARVAEPFFGGLLMLAEIQGSLGKFDEAVEHYRAAIALAPSLAEPRYQLALLYRRFDRLPEAVETCLEAVRLEPDSDEIVETFRQLSNGAPAVQASTLNHLVESFPRSAPLAVARGWAHRRDGNPAAALGEVERARALRSNHQGADLLRAELHLDAAQLAEAEAVFRATIERYPRSHRAHYGLGRVLSVTDRLGEAERHFESSLRIEPGAAEVYSFRGGVLERQGSRAAAVQMYRKALEIDPDDRNARRGLGRLSADAG